MNKSKKSFCISIDVNVKEIDLDGNLLTAVPDALEAKSTSLERLHLARNKLDAFKKISVGYKDTSVFFGWFTATTPPKITYLDMSSNLLTTLPSDLLSELAEKTKMTFFNVSRNKLLYLSKGILDHITPAGSDLTYNEWLCTDCETRYLNWWLVAEPVSSRPVLNCSSGPLVADVTPSVTCEWWFWAIVIAASIIVLIVLVIVGILLLYFLVIKPRKKISAMSPADRKKYEEEEKKKKEKKEKEKKEKGEKDKKSKDEKDKKDKEKKEKERVEKEKKEKERVEKEKKDGDKKEREEREKEKLEKERKEKEKQAAAAPVASRGPTTSSGGGPAGSAGPTGAQNAGGPAEQPVKPTNESAPGKLPPVQV